MKTLKALIMFALVGLGFGQEERFELANFAQFSTAAQPVHPSLKIMMMFVRTQDTLTSFIPTVDSNGDLEFQNLYVMDHSGQIVNQATRFKLPKTWTMDMESLALGINNGQEDLFFRVYGPGSAYLEPQNGAEIAIVPLECYAMPMAAFQSSMKGNDLDIQPTSMFEPNGWDWAAMAPVNLPRSAFIVRFEAEITDDPGFMSIALNADQYGSHRGIASVSRSQGNTGSRMLLDDPSMNFDHEPHRETLYVDVVGTGEIRLHSVRVIYFQLP